MAASKSTKFEVRGINHMALVCSNVEETVTFYTEVLGLPLAKTEELPNGGQHLYFGVSDHSGLSFYWFPDAPPAAPGLASAYWTGGIDPNTGQRIRGGPPMSAIGSMNHVAFEIPIEEQQGYVDKLRAAGIEVTEINHHILYGQDGKQVTKRENLPPDAELVDEFINSIYFPGPDGIVLEFAAYTRPMTPEDVKHTPARAQEEEVEARLGRQQRAAAAGA